MRLLLLVTLGLVCQGLADSNYEERDVAERPPQDVMPHVEPKTDVDEEKSRTLRQYYYPSGGFGLGASAAGKRDTTDDKIVRERSYGSYDPVYNKRDTNADMHRTMRTVPEVDQVEVSKPIVSTDVTEDKSRTRRWWGYGGYGLGLGYGLGYGYGYGYPYYGYYGKRDTTDGKIVRERAYAMNYGYGYNGKRDTNDDDMLMNKNTMDTHRTRRSVEVVDQLENSKPIVNSDVTEDKSRTRRWWGYGGYGLGLGYGLGYYGYGYPYYGYYGKRDTTDDKIVRERKYYGMSNDYGKRDTNDDDMLTNTNDDVETHRTRRSVPEVDQVEVSKPIVNSDMTEDKSRARRWWGYGGYGLGLGYGLGYYGYGYPYYGYYGKRDTTDDKIVRERNYDYGYNGKRDTNDDKTVSDRDTSEQYETVEPVKEDGETHTISKRATGDMNESTINRERRQWWGGYGGWGRPWGGYYGGWGGWGGYYRRPYWGWGKRDLNTNENKNEHM